MILSKENKVKMLEFLNLFLTDREQALSHQCLGLCSNASDYIGIAYFNRSDTTYEYIAHHSCSWLRQVTGCSSSDLLDYYDDYDSISYPIDAYFKVSGKPVTGLKYEGKQLELRESLAKHLIACLKQELEQ